MCDFIAIASMGLGIAQSAMQYSAANAQYEQQMKVYEQNAINASLAAENQYSNISIRSQQEDAARVQQQTEAGIEAAKAASTAQVAASEGGVSGLSVDAMIRDIYAQQGRNDAALDANQRMSRDYLLGEMKSAEAQGQSQINSVPLPEKPSAAPYLLNAFGSGLSAYSDYVKRTS
jgi:hypothetical protein